MDREPLDLDVLALEAEALVVRLIGPDRLDMLVLTMLDYDVPPVFLWASHAPAVSAAADLVADAVRPQVSDLRGKDLDVLAHMRRALVFDRDPARGLLELATSPRYRVIPSSLLQPPVANSRVLTTAPSLRERIDKRGLLDLAGDLDPRPDVLFVGEWAVPYHQLLRRGFTAQINNVLIGRLLTLRRAGLAVRVAIDERRLHPRADHQRIEERDFWGGPPLTEAALDDPTRRLSEVRSHGWPEGAERLPWEIDEHVGVLTSLSGTTRTIVIEEVTHPSLQAESEFQLVRYVHAERDIGRHVFTHLDGAVRYYDRAAYEARRAARWPASESESPQGRRKVFRVDGDIDTAAWVEVVAQWFRGNRLILEALAELAEPAAADRV